jgi:ATP-dependent DNA helicase RecG
MRPEILNPLFSSLRSLPGVGDKSIDSMLRLLGNTRVIDAVMHLPVSVIDRTDMPDLTTVQPGSVISCVVEVIDHHPPRAKRRGPFKVVCKNDTGYLTITFFNGNKKYVERYLPIGQKRVVSGRVERFDGVLQMSHPDYIVPLSEIKNVLIVEPIYPLTYAVNQKMIGKIVTQSLAKIPQLPEWIDEGFLNKNRWNGWDASLRALHKLSTPTDLDPDRKERQRLAYDELLANQLALSLTRTKVKKQGGQVMVGNGEYRQQMLDALPFSLTGGQVKVLTDVYADMAEKSRMLRLLQGDVGSGKTVVALQAMLNAVEAGKQCALMAPTEILARQHAMWITKMMDDAGLGHKVRVKLLIGKDKVANKRETLTGLENGEIDIVIGTHALFQESVVFANLGFVVIDEQHRFGVEQRLTLSNKGERTDILLMTATPIPRTLTLTMYGDIDVSLLKEKPAGRLPIDTRSMPTSKADAVVAGLKRAVADGSRAYWVCPLIEEGEEGEESLLATAEARFRDLKYVFPDRVGLVHGKMKGAEKESVMQAFKRGDLDVLVATTVIEVGVDVPEATIMVIEEAQQFGLSQLHQLRGRVGRGGKKSSCILLYGRALSETGKRRLQIMRETEDGFRIAEEDLLLRGSGEILGTKQSGMQDFNLAVFPEHNEFLLAARDDVKLILQTDPALNTARGRALRTLLYLFEYDEQIKYMMSG